jgi:3-hydroxyisobutyrate dehydrogenase-like beta-hydroxyacid dehydrogenase
MKVTFIGLGIMGSRMAKNLLKHKVELTVYNRSKAIVEELVSLGAKTAPSAAEAVKEADIVFTMLSKPAVVQEVANGENGFLPHMKPNALWADSSTVNPSFSQSAKQWAVQNKLRFLDAPVAGTLPQAQNAELVFFVGGEERDVQEVSPLLDMMGKKTMHLGESTKGSAFKMLVNAMLAQSMLIFSETILLGEKMGFDSNFLLDVMPNLVVSAPFTKAKAQMIKADDYQVMFPLELMHKDLHLATTTAYEMQQPLLMANLAKELYANASKQGMGRLDFAAIHDYLKKYH